MKASAFGCPPRLPVASFPMMDIMETVGREIRRQPVSSPSPHVIDVKRQPTHFSSTSREMMEKLNC